MIVALQHDLMFPPARAGEAAAAIGEVDVVEIEGFGHADGPFGAAERVNRALIESFATHEEI